ncbi:MAG: hypothetical protein IKB71_06100 [Lentisphaeria bacterium]|nr:hypothetical protein [Lentisphaeria bacterium]
MPDNFFFNDIFEIERRRPDGSTEKFTVNGMARMKSVLDKKNGNMPLNEAFFLFAPDRLIMPGDNIIHGSYRCKIGKVEPICDLDGKLHGYRVNSL